MRCDAVQSELRPTVHENGSYFHVGPFPRFPDVPRPLWHLGWRSFGRLEAEVTRLKTRSALNGNKST